MTSAQLLIRTLESFGVDTIFGYPGAHNIAIYDALYDSTIRHVLVRHEQAAAFMADGYARASGKVGVCLTTAGPGATNAATAIAEAYDDSVPVLHLSGQVEAAYVRTESGAYHEMDLLAVFGPMTKWAAEATCADEVGELVCEAFRQLTNGRPRPVHLSLPNDVLKEETSAEIPALPKVRRSLPPPLAITTSGVAMRKSQRPMLWAGGGAIASGASDELAQLAQQLGAPVATTTMGRGAISDGHPLGLGWVRGKPAQAALSQADLLIAVGCRFGEVATAHWTTKFPPLIHIDIDSDEIGKNIEPQLGVTADARVALRALIEELAGAKRDPWFSAPAPEPERMDQIDGQIVPILRELLDRDAIVATDVGVTAFHMFRHFPVYAPRTFFHPATYIAMGHAVPAALGAKIAMPDRQVACITGDGAFMMVCQELSTAVQEQLPVPIIVINDGQLSAIKGIQRRQYPGRYIAVDLVNPDFEHLAQAFGTDFARIRRADDFKPALAAALASARPTLIEVVKSVQSDC